MSCDWQFLDVVTSESGWKELEKIPLITGVRHLTGVFPRQGQRALAVLDVGKEISVCILTKFSKLQMLDDLM